MELLLFYKMVDVLEEINFENYTYVRERKKATKTL